ncbi:MAG TPA: (Fe-S)-binding protein [Anaerolineales bacterium]|nr:(Fe-S)-binding protein [Anaerolineales bacterium]
MLIDSFEVEVFTPPCEPGAERFAARAHLVADISEVLPLLNATLKGAVYLPQANALTWKKGGHNVAFHVFDIATSNAADRGEAERELRSLVDLVNLTWERRAEIEPDYQTRQRPAAIALFRLLPQTNCKQCGQPTCFTFALQLAASQANLEACPVIFDEGRESSLAGLRLLLIDAPRL